MYKIHVFIHDLAYWLITLTSLGIVTPRLDASVVSHAIITLKFKHKSFHD